MNLSDMTLSELSKLSYSLHLEILGRLTIPYIVVVILWLLWLVKDN